MFLGKYWSCSKFADWVRGTPKPFAATSDEWRAWRKKAKAKTIRYWLVEEGFDLLEDFIYWPLNRIRDVRFYIDNRWITKSHALTSGLKRGQWYDLDSRLLHANFDELVNFVEIEQAWKHVACCNEARKKYKMPWYRKIFRIRSWRSPEAGISYLDWAAKLKNDEDWVDKNDPSYGHPTPQALSAQEVLALYKWWKDERPKRLDPMEASGLSAFYDERHAGTGDDEDFFPWDKSMSEEDEVRYREISDLNYKMETEQDDEDTEMLIRLIKIRHHLWT